jgi:hypothetical protein
MEPQTVTHCFRDDQPTCLVDGCPHTIMVPIEWWSTWTESECADIV